ncbi:DUF4864 domain-containing protein [Mangrovicoccus sp. HB161399]|uniref:DUF4864 domain-containing protein n=1 Tax=Mangrovicoccus sp. HB161399 TaxID=2720392 RepID=UPI0015564C1B|nr:DUF4864 domain-containing protein [Mangrovicoccus sp. HB161399]
MLSLTAVLSGSATLSAVMAMAQEDRGAAIRSVIDRQLEAFRAGDLPRAYGFVSRRIRGQLHSPQLFAQLMLTGFPMVWDPKRVTFLPLRQDGGATRQRVLIRDAGGQTHVLEYDMADAGGTWQIDGVRTLPAVGLGLHRAARAE